MPSNAPSFAMLPTPSQLLELRRGGVTKVNVFRTHIALVLAPVPPSEGAIRSWGAATTMATAPSPSTTSSATAVSVAAAESRGVRRRRNKRRALVAATCIQRVARGRLVRRSQGQAACATAVTSVAVGGQMASPKRRVGFDAIASPVKRCAAATSSVGSVLPPPPPGLAVGHAAVAVEPPNSSASAVPSAPALGATRLSVEVGRRAVQISQEVFEAAGVPVPPGYVKIRAGGLRRVVKERARAVG